MKTYAALTVSALIVASTMDSATAMKEYMANFPKGTTSIKTGHSEGTKNSLIGKAYGDAQHDWKKFCGTLFPGSTTIKIGEVFGDPCCTWTGSGDPDFEVSVPVTDETIPVPRKCPTGTGGGGTGDEPETPPRDELLSTPPTDTGSVQTKGETPETKEATPPPPTAETPPGSYGGGGTPPMTQDPEPMPVLTDNELTPPPASGSTPPVAARCAGKGARKLRS